MTITDPWVDIVFFQGDEYDRLIDEVNAQGGSTSALMAIVTEWDYGQETDDAHTTDGPSHGSRDLVFTEVYDGLEYTISRNDALGYLGVARRPLSSSAGQEVTR